MSVFETRFDTDGYRQEATTGAKSKYTPTDFAPCQLPETLIPTAIQLAEAMARGKQYKGRNRKIILAVAAWQAHAFHALHCEFVVFLTSYGLNPDAFHSLMKLVSPVQTQVPMIQNEPDLLFNLRRILNQLIGPLALSEQLQAEILDLGTSVRDSSTTEKLRPASAALVVAIYFLTHRSICTQQRAMNILSEYAISDGLFRQIYELVDEIYNAD